MAGISDKIELNKAVKMIFANKPERKIKVGWPVLRSLYDIGKDLRALKVKRWREKSMKRTKWALVVKVVKILR